MPDLVIRIKKKNDGSAALTCVRADGSTTWQQQNGPQGRFFPLHDLTHLAVETVLGLRRAFYGLIAEGWDIAFFAEPEARGDTPPEAYVAELIVGFLDVERATNVSVNADDFNWKIDTAYPENPLPEPRFHVTSAQLDAIRARRAELFSLWRSLPLGDTLELPFDRPAVSAF